jgi:hypothetical protein
VIETYAGLENDAINNHPRAVTALPDAQKLYCSRAAFRVVNVVDQAFVREPGLDGQQVHVVLQR